MRIKLKKGIQKKMILDVKNKKSLTWKDFSKKIGVSETYLKWDLFNEKRTLSEEVYHELCNLLGNDFDKEIIKKLEEGWGRSLGGINSTKKEKLVLNKKSNNLAELVGILLGDGNLWERKGGYYYISIAGDSEKDKDYLLNYVNPLFESLFNKKLNVKVSNQKKGMYLYLGDKNILFTLKNFGLKSGNKKKNNVGIPLWIFEKEEYLKACIKGLMDTDGSLCPITGRDYPYIWFSSAIENLRLDFSKAMKILKIKTSKWNIRKDRTPEIYIGNKKDIQKYIETINFKNKRHLNKLTPR
jgi:intein/homing endonuclease